METDLIRVWQLINDLSEQLVHNQKLATNIQVQASELTAQAAAATAGTSLRRIVTDISQETFESELERTNAHIIIENLTLSHENKQLSLLLKEYEATMETIMAKFRNHAVAAEQHELTLTRHYETLIHNRETQNYSIDLATSTTIHRTLQRLAIYLRALLRTLNGSPIDIDTKFELAALNADYEPGLMNPDRVLSSIATSSEGASPSYSSSGSASSGSSSSSLGAKINELQNLLESLAGGKSESDHYPELEGRDDWTVERECEIARLERENQQLRQLLGIDIKTMKENNVSPDVESEWEHTKYQTFLFTSGNSRRGLNAGPANPDTHIGLNGLSGGASGSPFVNNNLSDLWNSGGGASSVRQFSASIMNANNPVATLQAQQASPGLQNAVELQPGMRIGMTARRPAIFGAASQRGGGPAPPTTSTGMGVGRGIGIMPSSANLNLTASYSNSSAAWPQTGGRQNGAVST